MLATATVVVSSDGTNVQTLILCDGTSTHSSDSASFACSLKLVGEPVHLSISGFKAVKVIEPQRAKFNVSSEPYSTNLSFIMEAVKENIYIGTECINTPELQDKHPQLTSIKPLQYNYKDVVVVLGQDYYHADRQN